MFLRRLPFRGVLCKPAYYSWLRRFNSDIASTVERSLNIKLREYQEECIQAVLQNLQEGHKRLGISLATGSGKTVVFTHLIDRIPPNAITSGSQTLILVHRKELLEQAVRHCELTYPDKTIDMEMSRHVASGQADITVAMVRSLTSKDRLLKFDPSRFKLVLVDEAHHIVADSYMAVLRHFGLLASNRKDPDRDQTQYQDRDQAQFENPASPVLVGVSATLSRGDGLRLGAALDRIVYHKSYVDMIGEKWLSPVLFTTVKSHVDLSKVRIAMSSGDYGLPDLSQAANTDEANEIAVRSWLHKATSAPARKSTLVFAVDARHVRDLAAKFRLHGVDARTVLGDDRPADRARKLADFKAGGFPVLVNCGVFTEGTDIPNVDCVLLCRPTRSRNLLVQMIGRGMRLHPGKESCHVIDMVASLGVGIVTVPTLFGLDPEELVSDASAEKLRELGEARDRDDKERESQQQQQKQGLPVSKVTFTDYDSVHDLISDHSGDRHIRAYSKNSWVEVDQARYILTNRRGGFLEIEGAVYAEGPTLYSIRYNEKVSIEDLGQIDLQNSWRPFKRTREIGRAETLEAAVKAADTFAASNQHFEEFIMRRDATWRLQEASKGQLKVLQRAKSGLEKEKLEGINKGQATDLITKLKFGAKGRFKRVKAEAKRKETRKEREERVKRREHVQVGPLAS